MIMKVVRFALQILVVGLALLAGQAPARTLPPPDTFINLTSEQGEHLLLAAMNTIDPDNGHKSRRFVLICAGR
jgi:hypothetical protein